MKKRESKGESDGDTAEELARGGASNSEIGMMLGLKAGQIRKHRKRLELARVRRKVVIRQKQTLLAAEGNAAMLKLLGEIELEQIRQEKPRPENLPDFEKYPGVGYAAHDPRVAVMERNRVALEAEVWELLSMVKNYVSAHPGASVGEVIGALEGMLGREGKMQNDE